MVLSHAPVAEEQLSVIATEPGLLQASLPKRCVYALYETQPLSAHFEGLPHSQKGLDLWLTSQTKLVFKLSAYW